MTADPQARLRRLLAQKGIRVGAGGDEPGPRAPGEAAPLSFAQERLWFLQRLDPASRAYHLGQCFRLHGAVDTAALARAVEALLARHEGLRTGFSADADGRPVAQIALAAACNGILRTIALSGLPAAERTAAIAAQEEEVFSAPFDLAQPPLFRARLLTLAPDEHRFALCVHHLVFDGWSIAIVARELARLYSNFVSAGGGGAVEALSPLALSYGDYAAWQRRRAAAPAWSEALDWWAQHLRALPPLELPTDWPRPAQASGRGAGHRFELSAAAVAPLRELARRESTTLFVVLLAAYQALLRRQSGQTDFGVGVSVAGRTHRALEELAGMFVNTVVFRADLAGEPSFLALVRRVRAEAAEALARQETPFEQIVDRLKPERDLSRNPLFQAGFVVQNAPAAEFHLGGLSLDPIEAEIRAAKFDLLISCAELPDGGVRGTAEFSTDLFDAETIARLCARYGELLAAAIAAPEEPIDRLAWLTAADRAEVLGWSEGAQRAYPRDGWMHELPDRQPKAQRALAASDGQILSYAEFGAEAERLARSLRALGAKRETLVAVCLDRSIELVLALHATLRAGAAYVPLDPNYPAERLAWMTADANAAIVVTSRAHAGRFASSDPTAKLLIIDEPWPDGLAADGAAAALDGRNAAYMIYTSGSTGRPKGAINTHEAILNRLHWMQEAYPLGPDDVVLQKTPCSFDVSVWEFFWPTMVGATLAIAEPEAHRDPARLAALIREFGVTTIHFVPSMLRAFLDTPGTDRCPSLCRVICSGEELPGELAQRFLEKFDCELHNLYGPTEAAVDVTSYMCVRGEERVPIGQPIANLEAWVLDAAFAPVPRGVTGEVYLAGMGLGRGYHGRSELTAERWLPHPFKAGQRMYRTGDLGRWRADGAIDYLGRTDFQVKLRGQRIELGEIEAALRQHAAVRDAAVVLQKDRLAAFIVPRDAAIAAEELRRWLATRLPEHMVPAAWAELATLPLTSSGKIDRKALPTAQAAGVQAAYAPPRGEREELLAECWRDVLRVPRVGRDDGYFALGGDSILSIQLQAKVRARGWDFELADLFRNQTLAALAAALRPATFGGAQSAEAFALVAEADRARLPAGLEDAYPLTALQAGMVFHAELNPGAAAYHEVFSYEVRAPWSEAALREALAALARRHPVLRTAFVLSGYVEPLQFVHATISIPLAFEDLRDRPRAVQDAAVAAFIEADLARGFAWAEAPLWRAHAHRRTDTTWQFTLSAHHAILDGWSFAALLAELFAGFLERAAGRMPPAPALPPHFARYVALERAALADETSRQFWAQQLAEANAAKFPRRPGRAVPARRQQASAWRTWRGAELAALAALAARAGVSLKHVLLAAHLKVASVYSAQPDVTTGVITNGRPEEAGAEAALGLFLNTMPLRLRLAPGRWLDLIAAVFAAEASCWPHRRRPLAQLQKEQGGAVLFDTTFNYVNYHGLAATRDRADFELLDARYFDENSFSYFAQFSLAAAKGELTLELRYDPAEFTAEQADEFAESSRLVLAAMAADPAARHERGALLPPAEFERVVRAFNARPLPLGAPRLLHEAFFASAARTPAAVALIDGERRITYAELAARVHAWAARLQELGAGPERLVGVCLERSADLITALLAILESGAAYVPLDPAYPTERLAFLCADAHICALVSRPALAAARLPPGPWPLIDAADLAALPPSAVAPACRATPANLAYLIYTSGSTGRPKAAAIEHRNATALLAWARDAFSDDELAGTLAATSVCFDLSVFEIFATFAAGGKVIVADNALALPTVPARAEITLLNTVPSAAAEWIRQRAIPPGVRVVNLAGEPLPAALADQIYATGTVRKVHDLYGPSEDTTYSTWALRVPGGADTIGRVLPGSQLYLLDGNLQPAPLGAVGEIFIGGAGLARGYLGRPELTAERFVPDPFSPEPGGRLYRTGDLARFREDGQIEFLGRADQQVKIRGFRIELGEIQAVLEQHAAVAESAVLAREDDAGRKLLVAYVAGEAFPDTIETELRAWVAARLPEYFVPAVFVLLPKLPRNPNGKLDRAALPAALPSGATDAAARVAPRTPAEQTLAAIWAEVLRVPDVGIEDNYFALGGDSILALQVSARARAAGLAVSPRLLFEYPTVSALAAMATPLAPAEARPGADAADDGALTPIQHWFFAQDFAEPQHWNQSVLLRARVPLDAEALGRAFELVGARHPALRRRFERGADGRWRGVARGGLAFAFRVTEFATRDERTLQCAFEQALLDLTTGPLARAVWFAGGADDPGRLFIVIHHLAVDGVSWRILLEELLLAYEAARVNRAPAWSSRGTDATAWAHWLRGYVAVGGIDAERAHWAALAAEKPAPLPRDFAGGDNRGESAGFASTALDPEETETLLRRALAALGCQINDLLLAALALALREWTGREAHTLNLEGHGREPLDSGLELGRAVGWFTTLYPVRLDLQGAREATRALAVVQAQLAAVPRRGLGFGAGQFLAEPAKWGAVPAEICFNYLGQLDGAVGAETPFAAAEEPIGPQISPRAHRAHVVDVNGFVAGGALRFEWHFPTKQLRAETVSRLAERHLVHVRALLAAASGGGRAGGMSEMDAELDRAIAEIGL